MQPKKTPRKKIRTPLEKKHKSKTTPIFCQKENPLHLAPQFSELLGKGSNFPSRGRKNPRKRASRPNLTIHHAVGQCFIYT